MIDSIPYFIARISEDDDFFRLREMAENHDGWSLDYDRNNVKVWTKHVDDSNFNMVKVWAVFSDVNCVDLYDTIQDPEYRKEWDTHMIVGIDIGYLNPNNDVSYYAMYCPTPLKNRDLVLQKSWLDTGSEFYILNHSVCHKDYPPKKGFVRAISYFTGYFIRCQALNREKNGCELSYVTRTDPQGVLPPWLVNRCTQILAPKYVKQIEKAASRYGNWKSNNNPHSKPWVYPEQIKSPKLSVHDCVPCEEERCSNPYLRDFDFDLFLRRMTGLSSEQTITKSKKKPRGSPGRRTSAEEKNADCMSDAGRSCEGAASQRSSTASSSPRNRGRKSKKRLNALLNLTKMCAKRSDEE